MLRLRCSLPSCQTNMRSPISARAPGLRRTPQRPVFMQRVQFSRAVRETVQSYGIANYRNLSWGTSQHRCLLRR